MLHHPQRVTYLVAFCILLALLTCVSMCGETAVQSEPIWIILVWLTSAGGLHVLFLPQHRCSQYTGCACCSSTVARQGECNPPSSGTSSRFAVGHSRRLTRSLFLRPIPVPSIRPRVHIFPIDNKNVIRLLFPVVCPVNMGGGVLNGSRRFPLRQTLLLLHGQVFWVLGIFVFIFFNACTYKPR